MKNSSSGTIASYTYDAEGRQITESDLSGVTDLYYSDQDQVVQENQGSLVTAEHVWSPFYVDAMIQTVTDPQVTTAESNGSVNTGFGTNTSNHSTTTTLSFGGEGQAVADGSDTLVAVAAGGTAKLLWYNASGGLDTAFGGGTGIVTVSGFTNWSDISGLVIQPNGMIDLAIQTTSGGMEVAQLNYNGSINSSFGSGGLATAGGSLPKTDGIALAANGDILLASVARANSSSATFYVAALNSSSGSLDSSFGSSGVASQTVSGSSGYYVSYTGFGVQPDGNIIVGGQYSEYISGSTVDGNVLVGFTPTGTVNSSFGTSGVASDALGAQSGTMVVAPGGQIYICSIVSDDDDDGAGFYLQRYLANGTLDTSFGSDGVAGVALDGEFEAVILNILASGQIVVGAGGYEGNFVLARFNLDGSLDTAFGSDGVETGAAVCYGMAMALTSSGEAVLVGDDTAETGIILQEFGTLSAPQTLYVEYDADFNVTSLTDDNGNVVERYSYDPYGNVTVLNPNGTVRGDGTAGSSFYGWVYLHQGLRLDVATGLYDDENRIYDPSLGRFLQQDPTGAHYVDGPNVYQYELSNPIVATDSSGLDSISEPVYVSDPGYQEILKYENLYYPKRYGNGSVEELPFESLQDAYEYVNQLASSGSGRCKPSVNIQVEMSSGLSGWLYDTTTRTTWVTVTPAQHDQPVSELGGIIAGGQMMQKAWLVTFQKQTISRVTYNVTISSPCIGVTFATYTLWVVTDSSDDGSSIETSNQWYTTFRANNGRGIKPGPGRPVWTPAPVSLP